MKWTKLIAVDRWEWSWKKEFTNFYTNVNYELLIRIQAYFLIDQ